MQRSLIVLLLGITIGLIAASLDWRGTQQRSKFLFDQNVKCQQVARQYETENRVAVVKVTYSPSRSSCVAEVTRPPQNGSIDFTVDDLLSGELLFVGRCTVGEFLDKSNEKFKALSKDQDAKFAQSTKTVRSMNTAIIVAIVALVSTIVGAMIGAATNYVLAVRRERADERRESRDHAIEVKRAARLIDLELELAQSLAALSIEKRYWVEDAELSAEAWQKYRGTIAPDLSNRAWHAVTTAFLAAEHIKGARAVTLAGVLRDRPISDDLAAQIAPMLRHVTLGREALAPFAYSPEASDSTQLTRG